MIASNITTNIGKRHYMPGLDGLRALSVLVVVAYHLNAPWAFGGFLGVGVFFTLSGYLITDQLLAEWVTTGKIDLKDFWLRRVRRLFPAMFVLLAVLSAGLFVFDQRRFDVLQDGLLSAAFYFHNWWLIFHNVSYFESFGPASPIGHLWSLAIEEQFYLLWPLLIALGLRLFPRRGGVLSCILVGAVVSALAMASIYVPGADPSRVYYGTDTRAFALLVGAALAMVWPSRRLSAKVSRGSRVVLDLIGGAGLLAILWLVWQTNEYDETLYRGGLALFSILSAMVIAVLAHPASIVAKMMGSKPLQWIGKRSYSLYLWHYPVIILTNPTVDSGGFHIGRAVCQIILSFLLADMSWQFVEEPIRHGLLGRLWGRARRWSPQKSRYVLALPILSLILISCSSSLKAEQPSAHASIDAWSNPAMVTIGKNPYSDFLAVTRGPKEPTPSAEDQQAIEKSAPQEKDVGSETNTVEIASGKGITAIGDSVMLDAAPHLERLLPGIVIDGKVGRQMSQAQDVLDQLKADGKLGDRVIIELGTNGSFSKQYLRDMLLSIEGDVNKILLINTRVPRKWQDTVNSELTQVGEEFPKVTVVDWYSASRGKETFFADDGVHLKYDGAQYYASLIAEALQHKE